MDSASFQFVAFGLAIALLSNVSRRMVWRSAVLLLASTGFLVLLARTPAVLMPLLGFLFVGYVGILLLERGWSRTAVWSILAVVLMYVWLKKYSFLPEAVFLHAPYFTLGLSYIFFRVLHLLIDTRDRVEKRHIGPLAYLLYTINFTTFITGPIQRYDDFAQDQFAAEPIGLGARVVGMQLQRIVRGFFKVNVLAALFDMTRLDALSQVLHPGPTPLRMLAAFRIVVTYPLFLYCNFSGYIDIVIALARLMRVRLPENFDRPFSASSFLDFWSRWHISLSEWFRNYVYNPLLVTLMRRVSSVAVQPYLAVLCFFVTFFLVGIWHGRTSEFVFFGVLQGGGVAVNKLWQIRLAKALGRKRYKALASEGIYVALGRGLTYTWFALALFWFWADWKHIGDLFAALGIVRWMAVALAVWLAMAVVLAVWEWLRAALYSIGTDEEPVLAHRYVRVVFSSALGLAAVMLTVLLNQPAPGIVYKAF